MACFFLSHDFFKLLPYFDLPFPTELHCVKSKQLATTIRSHKEHVVYLPLTGQRGRYMICAWVREKVTLPTSIQAQITRVYRVCH